MKNRTPINEIGIPNYVIPAEVEKIDISLKDGE